MALSGLANLGTSFLQGMEQARSQQNPLGEAQLAHQMMRHQDMMPMYEAQTRESQVRAEAGEMALQQQRQQSLQQNFDRLNFSAQQYGGLSSALDRPAFRRQFMDLFNESPAPDALGHQLADIAVVNPNNPDELDALGMSREQAELFMQQHGGGERMLIPLVDNGQEFVPVDGPDGSIEAFSDLESWDYLQTVVTSPEVFGNAMAGARGQEQLGGEITIGGGGRRAPAEGADRLWQNMIQLESGGRQHDSNGNPLTSPAGATGIAQVMPDTAPEAARMAGLEWDEDRYRNDPEYNETIGRAYLDHQLEQFGDPMLAAAAYNAGPGRVNQWIKTYGDPRRGEISRENFAASIPFTETRNYVQGALEGVDVAPTRQERQQQQRAEEMPISTGALAALTPEAIQSAQQVTESPQSQASTSERLADWSSDASQGHQGGILGTPAGQFTETAAEAAASPPEVESGPQLGFEPEEFQSALARRVANDQPLNGGSGKRILDDEGAKGELARAATPERYQQAGQELLGGMQASGDGTTYRVQQSNNRPTGKQISQAVMLHAARPDLVPVEDVRRFIDTGTFTADGVGLIERGMMEASGTAQTQIQQSAQTEREMLNQMGQSERTRLQQEGQTARAQGEAEQTTPAEAREEWTAVFDIEAGARSIDEGRRDAMRPTFMQTMQEMSGLFPQAFRQGRWNDNDLARAQFRLYERSGDYADSGLGDSMRDLISGNWREGLLGRQNPELHKDPVAVAIEAQNPTLFESEGGIRNYVGAVTRYRDMLNGRNMDNRRNDKALEAQTLVNLDTLFNSYGGNWGDRAARDDLMEVALDAAVRGVPVDEYAQMISGQ